MSLGHRLGVLGATGVGVAGLAHAGWLALLWSANDGAGGLPALWVPLLAQVGLTLALAAAIAWQVRRSLAPLQQSLDLLRQQAQALEQGRFVIVQDPALPEALPLATSLNAAVRRMQSVVESGRASTLPLPPNAARDAADQAVADAQAMSPA